MKQFKKQSTFKSVCAFILAFMLMITNITGLVEVKAAGVPAPTIDKVFYDATIISGAGVHRARVSGKTVRGTIHLTLKNGDTLKHETSVIPNNGKTWSVSLPKNVKVEPGDVVRVYQEFDGQNSPEVIANAEPSMAYNHKNDLKMPSGDFYLEQFSSNIISEDEKAEALQMLKDSNPSFSDKIASIEFSIKGIEENKKAYYIVKYTDNSKTKEIEAPNLKIIKVTEHSRGYTVEPYNVVSTVIKGKLNGEGPFNDIKVQFSATLSESNKANFQEGGTCTIDKNSTNFQTIDVNPQTGEFSIDVGENTLKIGATLGIVIKEPHKFPTCNSSVTEIAIPKVDVKDPKKLKPEEKEAIANAIRKANTTPGGKSKLPDGNEYTGGIPAVIQIDDSGNVKIFSGSDVAGTWDWDNGGIFVPEKNKDGSYKLKDEAKLSTSFNKPEELLKNLQPDTPKMENKEDNIVVTPNIEVDTDAKKVVVEYEDKSGNKKTVTATKGNTGWTVDNNNAKVDENGVVSIPTKDIKVGTKVTASVEDNGGLVPEETALGSDKAELLIENKYKVVYKAGEGSGTMADEEVEAGREYTILKNTFTPPVDKEFDYWQVGFEKKKAEEQVVVNNDIEITAVYKYVINPTIDKIITKVDYPINYDMYKKAIKGFPSALKVEHIKVKKVPDISAIGTTEAEIEVRFSDGQFRTLKVTVCVIEDPKNVTTNELNKKVTKLNTEIDELKNTITEKDTKITELNNKITELENQLKTCQEQCAKDKEQCEKDKQALRDQIAELEKAKSNLEIQVKENRELIEQLRKQITSLEKQVEDWKKIVGEKDTKIKELENNIKDLNTKLDTANNANTELTKQLATATEKITGLENKIRDLESKVEELNNKVTELNKTIEAKDAEIKTLNDTITTLKEKVATLETEKAKDKEAYDKDKAELERQIQEAKDALATKEKELGNVKTELEQVKNDLSTEKAKTAGLEEQVKAKDEMITKLNKDIEELKAQLAKAKDGNTTIVKEKETIIKEKETLIEKLTSEKSELEKQLAAEKAKNENLEKQITDLNAKVDKANKDLNKANENIFNLEKELAAEKAKNAEIMKQLEKLGKDLDDKNKEVTTLNKTITTLKEQVAKLETEKAKDKEQFEAEKTALQKKLDNANQELTKKNEEVNLINNKLEQIKKELENEKINNATLTEQNKAKDEKIAELEKQLADIQGKLNQSNDDLKKANDRIAELEKELLTKTNENKVLTEQVEKLGKDLETKTNEVNTLTNKVSELENQVAEQKAKSEADAKEIERLTKELEDLRKQLANKNTEVEGLNNQIITLKETVKTLEGEKTELTNNVTRLETEVKELKDKLETADNKIIELEKENARLIESNKNLSEKVTELDKKVKKTEEENLTLKDKIEELNKKLAEANNSQCDADEFNKLKQEKAALEAKLEGKDDLIQELRNQIAEFKEQLKDLNELRDKVKELEIRIVTLTNENTNLKADLDKANEKITNLENQLAAEKTKNTELSEEVDKLKEAKDNLEGLLKKSEEDKNKLQDEKKELEKDLAKLKEDLSKCPADESNKIKELEEKITEKENLIKEKDKNILDKDSIIKELKEKLDYANNKIEGLNKKLKESESKPTRTEKEYVYIRDPYERDFRNRYERDCGDYYRLERDYMALKKENKELLDEIKKLKDRVYNLTEESNRYKYYKEDYVTLFSLDSFLYKTFLGTELMTQAEMTDFKGYIKPFISNSRTMLPMRYTALSLGLDVYWNNATRTATFVNSGMNNALIPGTITINANTLEMKNQYGQVINVDSKPVLKEGRFYVSIANIIKAFGGTQGYIDDGVKNTIEWNPATQNVLVYKYIK